MTLPLYSTIIDRRDGARCVFHRWFTVKRHGRKYKRARVAVLNMPCAERWRSIPERFVEPVLLPSTIRKKRRTARQLAGLAQDSG